MIQLTDLIKNPEMIHKLQEYEQVLSTTKHRNIKNYHTISSKINEYDSFEILIEQSTDRIVAFSGLKNCWGRNFGRVASATFYDPQFRSSSLNRTVNWAESFLIPYEIEIAKSLGYDFVFISIELLIRRNSLIHLIKKINKIHDLTWEILPDMYNTCRQVNAAGDCLGVNPAINCWQNVAVLSLNTHRKPDETFLPSMTLLEYSIKFGSAQAERLSDR